MTSRRMNRCGLLALGLAIGATCAHMPAIASADSSTGWWSSIDTLVSGGLAGPSPDLDVAISFNGVSLFAEGSAVADSGTTGDYDLAIAYGANATAFAHEGSGNFALAIGPAANAAAAFGNGNSAAAFYGNAMAGFGNNNVAMAIGDHAGALGGNYDSAFQMGRNGYALAGDGNNDAASVMGSGNGEFTTGGFSGYNVAYAGGTTGLSANANVAAVFGNGSNAVAGSDMPGGGNTAGDHDFAGVFGSNNESASATGTGGLYDWYSVFGHAGNGTAATPSPASDAVSAATAIGTPSDAATAVVAPGDAATAANGYNPDFLTGSTDALVLGPTGISTPDAAYINDGLNLYLYPSGYDGSFSTTLPLTTPENYDFQSSVLQGENDLTNAVLADYEAGAMGCNAAGVCSDPLTIFTYSQSSAIAALDEPTLAQDGIPSDALRFVMLGANPTGVPDTYFPTEIYNIHGDTFAEPGVLGTSYQAVLLGAELHDAYLGLTQAEIEAATPTAAGLMTTIYEIPTLTSAELWTALLAASATGT